MCMAFLTCRHFSLLLLRLEWRNKEELYSNNNSLLRGDIHEQTECWIEQGQRRPLFAREKVKEDGGKRGSPPSRGVCVSSACFAKYVTVSFRSPLRGIIAVEGNHRG